MSGNLNLRPRGSRRSTTDADGSQPSTSASFRSGVPLRRSARLMWPKQDCIDEKSIDEFAHAEEPAEKLARIDTAESDASSTPAKVDVEETEYDPYWLPVELWAIIFSHLCFRGRMNARLVCHLWCEEIMRYSCVKEKLLCSAPYHWETIVETIQESKRKILNLEFHRMKMWSDDKRLGGRQGTREFWQQCGPKMKYLHFSDCEPMDEVILYVVQYCTTLESLTFEWSGDKVAEQELRMCSPKRIDSLIRMNVTRDSLTFFKLKIRSSSCVTNHFLRAIKLIYPKIKQFSIVCGTVGARFDEEHIPDSGLLQSAGRCTAAGIVNQLIKSNQLQLEGIYLSIDDYQQLSYYNEAEKFTSFVVSLHFPRLREVELELMTFDQQHRDFFSRHIDLSAVDLELFTTNAAGEDMTRVMNSVLDSCPHLRSLRLILKSFRNIINTTPPTVSSSVFAKITKSRLKTLTFNYELGIAPEDTETVNDRLESLRIVAPGIGSDAFRPFMKVFRGLRRLEVNKIQDDGLQAIFQYQRYLKSLTLTDWHDCTDYGFTGCRSASEGQSEGFSVQRLSGLQYLDLQATKSPHKVTEKSTREFKLPNLLYLYVTIDRGVWKAHNDFMSGVLQNSPKLEGIVTFTYLTTRVDFRVPHPWISCCKLLKNLRYLKIAKRNAVGCGNPSDLFTFCPKLRAVTYQQCPASGPIIGQVYSRYYDVVERRMKHKCDNEEYRISSRPIDSNMHMVDKMWY